MSVDDYSYTNYYCARATELADIAAMDRLAGDLQPQATVERWARRRNPRTGSVVRRIRRLTHLA